MIEFILCLIALVVLVLLFLGFALLIPYLLAFGAGLFLIGLVFGIDMEVPVWMVVLGIPFLLILGYFYFFEEKEDLSKTVKECPYCKNEVRGDAVKCGHCGSSLED